MNKEIKEVSYYWFHHNAMSIDRRHWINKAIINHDWEAFCTAKELYDADNSPYKLSTKGEPMVYFPDRISISYSNGDIEGVFMNEENFNKITHSEFENG